MFVFDSCFFWQSVRSFAFHSAGHHRQDQSTVAAVSHLWWGQAGGARQEHLIRVQFDEAFQGEADANQDSYVTAAELAEFVINKVTNYSRGAQAPQHGKIRDPNLDKGDFVFEVIVKPDTKLLVPLLTAEAGAVGENKLFPQKSIDMPSEDTSQERWKAWQEGMYEIYFQLQKIIGGRVGETRGRISHPLCEDHPYSVNNSRLREEVRSAAILCRREE